MTFHEWTPTSGPNVQVHTCEKCGLIRVTTPTGEFFFTQLDRQFTACPSPYGEAA